MSLPVASKVNVTDYLVEVYALKPGVVAEVLAEDAEKWRELARGVDYRSNAQYVGDLIADHAGLTAAHYSEDRYQQYEARYLEDD